MDTKELNKKLRSALTGIIRTEFNKQREIIAKSINDDPALIEYLNTLDDSALIEKQILSEIKQDEKDRQFIAALAGKSSLVEIVSHDGNSSIYKMSCLLSRLKDGANSTTVEQLKTHFHLFYSKYKLLGSIIESKYVSVIKGEEVKNFIGWLHDSYKWDIDNGKIEFTKDFLDLKIRYKKALLYTIFENLICNSFSWTYDKEESKKIIICKVGDEVIVADNGPGVPEEDIPNLFKLYHSTRIGGRGIGLYSTKQNLEMFGGSIYYITDPSKKILSGANFCIRFKDLNLDSMEQKEDE